MKEEEKKHPPQSILFQSFYLNISQPQIGTLTINFEDHSTGNIYKAHKPLQRISYKTVVTALRQTEPSIIKAVLAPYQDSYLLAITVKLQYLNEIEQIFEFKRQAMKEQRRRQLQENSRRKEEINKIKKELLKSQKQYVIGGTLENKQRIKHEVCLDVPHDTTLFNLTLSFMKLQSNIIKVGYYYYDTLTKSKVSENLLPEELYSLGITELCLVAEKSKFDKVVITVEGQFQQANYTIKVEGAIDSTPLNIQQMVFRVAAISFCIWVIYTFNYYLKGSSSGTEM